MIAYKVVRRFKHERYKSCVQYDHPDLSVTYKIGKFVSVRRTYLDPKFKNYLFCFKTFEDAIDFVQNRDGFCFNMIFKAVIKPCKDENVYCQIENFPEGTILAEKVKLLEEVI